MKVVISRAAEMDMVDIGDWIARDSDRAAGRMINRILVATEGLTRSPVRYPVVGNLNVRKRTVGDYVILYRVDDAVRIVRILHSARDWLSLLDDA